MGITPRAAAALPLTLPLALTLTLPLTLALALTLTLPLNRVKELAPQHGSRAEDVLLFFRDDSSGYRFPHVVQLYEEEKQRAVAKGLAVPPDGLPDPSNVDGDLSYHLEPYPYP